MNLTLAAISSQGGKEEEDSLKFVKKLKFGDMQQIFGEVQVLSLITGLHHQSFTHQFNINRLNEIQDD